MALGDISCSRCFHHQPNPTNDAFFQKNVKPLMYFCCIILPSAYLIGIWFSLRTHVKQIWHEPPARSIRDSSIYKKLLPIHILQQLLHYGTGGNPGSSNNNNNRPYSGDDAAEMGRFTSSAADTAGYSTSNYQSTGVHGGLNERHAPPAPETAHGAGAAIHPDTQGLLNSLAAGPGALKSDHGDDEEEDEEAHGGHDSPNWSKAKSATVLLGCTVLYSIIAGTRSWSLCLFILFLALFCTTLFFYTNIEIHSFSFVSRNFLQRSWSIVWTLCRRSTRNCWV